MYEGGCLVPFILGALILLYHLCNGSTLICILIAVVIIVGIWYSSDDSLYIMYSENSFGCFEGFLAIVFVIVPLLIFYVLIINYHDISEWVSGSLKLIVDVSKSSVGIFRGFHINRIRLKILLIRFLITLSGIYEYNNLRKLGKKFNLNRSPKYFPFKGFIGFMYLM